MSPGEGSALFVAGGEVVWAAGAGEIVFSALAPATGGSGSLRPVGDGPCPVDDVPGPVDDAPGGMGSGRVVGDDDAAPLPETDTGRAGVPWGTAGRGLRAGAGEPACDAVAVELDVGVSGDVVGVEAEAEVGTAGSGARDALPAGGLPTTALGRSGSTGAVVGFVTGASSGTEAFDRVCAGADWAGFEAGLDAEGAETSGGALNTGTGGTCAMELGRAEATGGGGGGEGGAGVVEATDRGAAIPPSPVAANAGSAETEGALPVVVEPGLAVVVEPAFAAAGAAAAPANKSGMAKSAPIERRM